MANQTELADYLDLSTTRIRVLKTDGIIPAPKGTGGYDLDACRLSYIRYLRNLASGKVKGKAGSNTSERTRLLTAQADRAELDLKIAQGEYIPAEMVSERWSRVASDFKARILSIPARMISKTLAAKSPAEIEIAFKELLFEALDELSTDGKKEPKKPAKKKQTKSKKSIKKKPVKPKKKTVKQRKKPAKQKTKTETKK